MFRNPRLWQPALAAVTFTSGVALAAYTVDLEQEDIALRQSTHTPVAETASLPAPTLGRSARSPVPFPPQAFLASARAEPAVALPSAAPLAAVDRTADAAAPPCTERWRPLESGPEGRYVVELCPNVASVPPAPPSAPLAANVERLPTPEELGPDLANTPLATPSREAARSAGEQVARSLDRWLGAHEAALTPPPLPPSLAI
jgi:hypothetical protein